MKFLCNPSLQFTKLYTEPHSQLFLVVDIYNFANNLIQHSVLRSLPGTYHLNMFHTGLKTKMHANAFFYKTWPLKHLRKYSKTGAK
jgi:hypothetical protein